MARTMTNAEVAATFRRLTALLAIRGEDAYRVGAYRRAAASIGQTPESIAALRQRGGLQEIPGVGVEIAQKIADLLDTGSFRLLREVEAQFPPGIASLLAVPGIGPRRARAPCTRLWASTARTPCAPRWPRGAWARPGSARARPSASPPG